MTTKTTSTITEQLQQAGVSVCWLYESKSEPGVYQAECYGKVQRKIKQFEQAGFVEVKGEQDWMDDEPYSLIRFRLPVAFTEPQTAAYQAAVDNVWFEQMRAARDLRDIWYTKNRAARNERIDYTVDLEIAIEDELGKRGLGYQI